uniref:Fructose-1,6-bisphosphatase class 3 n=1 Tax=Lygus hesperus TaxID=30085 RepID=A0A0A9XMK5_LYGHE
MHLPPDPVAINSISNVGATTATVFANSEPTGVQEEAQATDSTVSKLQYDTTFSAMDPRQRTQYYLEQREQGQMPEATELPQRRQSSLFQTRSGGVFETLQDSNSVTSMAESSPFDEECFQPLITNNPTPFTVRRASVERNLYSLINPLGLIHPAMEIHHFAVSGVYSSTNTYFMDFIIERVS